MEQVTFAAAIVLWGVLPGLALMSALGLGWSVAERLAAAPGLSLALVASAAYATEIAGLAVAPLPVLGMAIVISAAIVLLGRAFPATAPGALDAAPAFPPSRPSWLPWLIFLLPQVIIRELEPLTTVVLLPPTLHDGLDHANWFRLIYETQSLNPHAVLAPPLTPDGGPTYYPWGVHGWLALVAQTTTIDPMTVLMQGLVLISAVLPLSVYVFVAQFTGRGWPAIAAAALTLLFWWLPYQVWGWGGYALLAGAVAALPLSRLALAAVDRWSAPGLAAAGVCGAGVLLLHPSQAMLALVVTVVVTVTLAASRALSWRTTAPFVTVLAAAGVMFTAGASLWDPLRAFVARAARIAATYPPGRYDWPQGVYFADDIGFPIEVRIVLAALSVLGAGVAWWLTPARPLVVLHVVFSLLIPAAKHHTWLTSLWYHAPERLWYAQYATLPALAALGLAGLVTAVERLLARWRLLPYARLLLWPLALWTLSATVYPAYEAWTAQRLFLHAHRNPSGTISDRRILTDYAWIRANIPAGEVIFNAPADWGLPLPFTGRRTVFWSGGHAMDPVPPWYTLLDALGRGDPAASQAAAELHALGVQYVYAASISPALEVGRQRLSRQALKQVARLDLVYESPTAAVFRIRDEGARRFGVEDSERIQFIGFHAPESRAGRQWRWTIGDGQLRLRTAGLAPGGCVARLHGPDPNHYYFRIDGDEIALTEQGYPVAAQYLAGELVEVLIRVPERLRKVDGTGAAARPVGVRVTNVELRCG